MNKYLKLKFEADKGGASGGGEQKTDATAEVEKPQNLAEFNSKFSARNVAPNLVGKPPTEEQIKSATTEAPKPESTEQTKKPAFIPRLVEEKRAAEQEAKEAKSRAAKYEKEDKPALESRISDLQRQIEQGVSQSKETELNSKITQLEETLARREEALSAENKTLKDRLTYYDLSENEDFQAEYVKPVINAHKQAVQALNGDERKTQAFNRALIANKAALSARNQQEHNQAIAERDDLLSSITDGMNAFTASRFSAAVGDYINNAERHAQALGDHTKTAESIKQKAVESRDIQKNQILSTWGKAYDVTAEAFKDEESVPKELEAKIKELGIDVKSDLEQAGIIAKKTIGGRASMNESVEIIHRGRMYPVIKASLAASQAINKELRATIEKLRGAGTGGGERTDTTARQTTSREDFHKRFQPTR